MVVGEFTQETDLVVIGGGPAGYTCAFRAAELGVKTVIVDARNALGGVCLHEGCVPSKTLLHVADTIHLAEHAAEFGVSFSKPKIDHAAVRSWTGKTIGKLAAGLESLCKKHGVERVQGRAHFEDSRHIALLDGAIPRIRFRRAVIAAGSVPKLHPQLPFDGGRVLTGAEATALETIPKSLLIIGSDYMAVELAAVYAAMGADVTLISETERLLPEADADLVRPVQKQLETRLAAVHLGVKLNAAEVDKKSVSVRLDGDKAGKPLKFDLAIITTDHLGNSRGLQLEKTQIKVDEHEFIPVDGSMRTADPRIFAAGDITGGPLLADRAIAQGRVAGEVIAGRNATFDARAVPAAIFSDPQIAWCGLTENQARNEGIEHALLRVPWGASGRAVGMGRAEGVTKIIYDPASELVLGVGIAGYGACELIGEAALAIEMGAVLTDFAATLHPHPTVSELISDAARQKASS